MTIIVIFIIIVILSLLRLTLHILYHIIIRLRLRHRLSFLPGRIAYTVVLKSGTCRTSTVDDVECLTRSSIVAAASECCQRPGQYIESCPCPHLPGSAVARHGCPAPAARPRDPAEPFRVRAITSRRRTPSVRSCQSAGHPLHSTPPPWQSGTVTPDFTTQDPITTLIRSGMSA